MGNPNVFHKKVEKEIAALKLNEKPKEKGTKEELLKEKAKYEKLKDKLKELKKKLKATMPKYTEDQRITEKEANEIFKSISPELLKELGIENSLHLMNFTGIYSISEQKLYMEINDKLITNPKELFKNVAVFKNAPWAFEVLCEAIFRNPTDCSEETFENIKLFIEKSWAINIVSLAAPFCPDEAVRNYSLYKKLTGSNEIFKMVASLADGSCLFDCLEDFINASFAKDILQSKFLKDPESSFLAFSKIDKYSHMPWAEEIIKSAIDVTPNENFEDFFKILKNKNLPHLKEIVIYAINKKVDYFLTNYFTEKEKYKDIVNEKDVLNIFINHFINDPSLAIKYYPLYKDMPYAKKIIQSVSHLINKNDLPILNDDFPELVPEEQKNVLKILDRSPEKAFTWLEAYEKQPYAKNILIRAAIKYPKSAIIYFKNYKDKIYAQEILETAIKAIDGKSLNEGFLFKSAYASIKFLKSKTEKYLISLLNSKMKDYKKFIDDILGNTIQYTINSEFKNIKPKAGEIEGRSKQSIDLFWNDPSVKKVLKIPFKWIIINKFVKSAEKNDLRLMVARNLYFQNKKITFINVQTELKRILEQPEEYKDTPVFKGRKVLMMAHNEKWANNTYRFGCTGLMENIKKQGGKIQLFREESNMEGKIIHKKKNILKAITNTPPPLTIYFDAHGAPDGIYFSNKSTIHINQSELVEALKKRNEKYANEPTPIIIYDQCNSSKFLRGVYQKLKFFPKPISIGTSEYGQLGFSGTSDEIFMFKDNKTHPITLKNIILNSRQVYTFNSVIYIPSKKGRIMQVAEKKRKKQRKTIGQNESEKANA